MGGTTPKPIDTVNTEAIRTAIATGGRVNLALRFTPPPSR